MQNDDDYWSGDERCMISHNYVNEMKNSVT
jgi:hypothetical protein